MQSKDSRNRAETWSLCADLHADDGPPQRRRKESRDEQHNDRKTMQLAAQIRRALHGAFPTPGSQMFDGLIVEAVEPDPDATHMRVVISVPSTFPHSVALLRQRLAESLSSVRIQVAASIHRKRVPTLTFDLVPREDA